MEELRIAKKYSFGSDRSSRSPKFWFSFVDRGMIKLCFNSYFKHGVTEGDQ